MQRKASYYVGLMKPGKSMTQQQSSPSKASTAPETTATPQDATIVPVSCNLTDVACLHVALAAFYTFSHTLQVASSSEPGEDVFAAAAAAAAKAQPSHDTSGSSKGWTALRKSGAVKAAKAATTNKGEGDAVPPQPLQTSVRFQDDNGAQQGGGTVEEVDSKAFDAWMTRRKTSARLKGGESAGEDEPSAAVYDEDGTDEEEEAGQSERRFSLCPFLPLGKRKGPEKRKRRHTVQEYFYQV